MKFIQHQAERPAHLYRHFNADGKLLYVGISISALVRLGQHREHSTWFSNIRRVEIQHFASRQEARSAEAKAIQVEQPLWNIKHAPGLSPATKPLGLSIDARVALAAQRLFAGKPRGKQLSDYIERQLIRKCIAAGEKLPEELLTKPAK